MTQLSRPARDEGRDLSGPALEAIIDQVRGGPQRTWSIIVTLYGDAVVPRGGCVWLGTLLAFFGRLGIADGVVRTAMSRLASDGWLERRRVGRNSFYRLAEKGRDSFREAAERIYGPRAAPWGGHFELLLPDPATDRERVRAALDGAGLGQPSPGLWIATARATIPDLPFGVLKLQARGDEDTNRALAARGWPLDALGEAYSRFTATFAPLRAAFDAGESLGDLDALVARVLLIHAYRRIVLRDPALPAEVLGDDWPGAVARELCAEVYGRVLPASERWLDAHATGEDGAALPPARGLEARFKA